MNKRNGEVCIFWQIVKFKNLDSNVCLWRSAGRNSFVIRVSDWPEYALDGAEKIGNKIKKIVWCEM